MDNIQACGEKLMQWAKHAIGNIRSRKKDLYTKIDELQKLNPSDAILQEIRSTEAELDGVLKKEETMWFQRSRAMWLKDGDKTSKFFHEKATHRKLRNSIKMIENEEGQEVKKEEEIKKVILDYFVNVFTSVTPGDDEDLMNALECTVTPDINEALMKPFTAEEVYAAIKQMHPAKAPGPDGMTPLFYQKFWHLCKREILKDVLGVLNNFESPSHLNHTYIVLIPKVKKPKCPKDLRPISLSNVVARILTKTIANRLKPFLSDVIYESQSAFILGRLITDNAMTAFEIFIS